LAFGQDEEISGPRGVNSIGKYLELEYGRNGISMIVDEGRRSLEMVYGKGFALPGIAEKGYIVSLYFLCSHNFCSNFIH
jgi:Gly-Xaa carboxypeptidase